MIGLLFLILFLLFLLVVLFVIMFIYCKLKAPKAIRIMAALFIPLAPIVWFVSDEIMISKQMNEICKKNNIGKAQFDPNKISNITIKQKIYLTKITDTIIPVRYWQIIFFNSQTGEFLYQFERFEIIGQSKMGKLVDSMTEGKVYTVFVNNKPCETSDIPNLDEFNSKLE